MHGEEDVRAPYRQYELVVERLRADGKDFESHSYPGEPHGFRNPENRIDMYERLEAFFDARLRDGGALMPSECERPIERTVTGRLPDLYVVLRL